MVLLTQTPTIVSAIQAAQSAPEGATSLPSPSVGAPIYHVHLLRISQILKDQREKLIQDQEDHNIPPPLHLNDLLYGTTLYKEPPPRKPEPSPEYIALMSRLRHEEQARIYERMLSPHPETFPPTASPLTWDSRTPFSASKDSSEDEITYADVNRQLILIINVIVSIIACSVFMWVAARRWSTPRRLALSMVTSILVAMAEVVIYAGYIRRVKEAKIAEKKRPEVKEVLETWVSEVKARDGEKEKSVMPVSSSIDEKSDDALSYRKVRRTRG